MPFCRDQIYQRGRSDNNRQMRQAFDQAAGHKHGQRWQKRLQERHRPAKRQSGNQHALVSLAGDQLTGNDPQNHTHQADQGEQQALNNVAGWVGLAQHWKTARDFAKLRGGAKACAIKQKDQPNRTAIGRHLAP